MRNTFSFHGIIINHANAFTISNVSPVCRCLQRDKWLLNVYDRQHNGPQRTSLNHITWLSPWHRRSSTCGTKALSQCMEQHGKLGRLSECICLCRSFLTKMGKISIYIYPYYSILCMILFIVQILIPGIFRENNLRFINIFCFVLKKTCSLPSH